jgi:hypothetical protein
MLRMIGRNCVEGGRSMQSCVKRAGFVFSRVLFRNRSVNFNLEGTVLFSAFLNLSFIFRLLSFLVKNFEESEMLLLRMIGRNGVGGGTSMQFWAKRGGLVFLCVLFRNRFVDGNLEGNVLSALLHSYFYFLFFERILKNLKCICWGWSGEMA